MVRHTFATLNMMRGVAAISVALLHAGQQTGHDLAVGGYLAVDFFFLLSGFIIAHAYDGRLSAGMSVRSFFAQRFARLYPLYIALAPLAFALLMYRAATGASPFDPAFLIMAAALGLLFLPAPWGPTGAIYPLNPLAWTLLAELLANALYAAFHRFLSSRVLIAILVTSGALLIACTLFYGDGRHGYDWPRFHVALIRVSFSFTAGVLLYRHRHSVPAWVRLPPLAATCLLIALLWIDVPWSARAAYDLIFVVILSPLLVAVGAASEPRDRWLPTANYLGLASYAIYALHGPLYLAAREAHNVLGISLVVTIYGSLIAILLLTPVIDRYYDKPFRAYLVSRLHGARALSSRVSGPAE